MRRIELQTTRTPFEFAHDTVQCKATTPKLRPIEHTAIGMIASRAQIQTSVLVRHADSVGDSGAQI